MFIDARLDSLLQSELEPGERLLWAGQPAPKRQLVRSLPAVGLGIVWTASIVNFMVGWYDFPERDISGPGGLWGFHGIVSSLFFVPFVLIGVGMLLSPVWAYVVAQRTVYAVTDNRVFIVEGSRSRKVRSYGKGEIGNIERVERADGTGNLTFAQKLYKDSDGDQRTEDVKFLGIAGVRSVERLLRDTFAKGT